MPASPLPPRRPASRPPDRRQPQSYPFAGGTLTITETEDFDKVLAFDGKELTRNYVVNYDKTVEVGGQQVALFDVGDGGNQCGTATVIVWKPENGAVAERCCRR